MIKLLNIFVNPSLVLFVLLFMVPASRVYSAEPFPAAKETDGVTSATPIEWKEGVAIPQPSEERPKLDGKAQGPSQVAPSMQGIADQKEHIKEEVVKQTSKDFVRRAWEASHKKDLENLEAVVQECLALFEEKAKAQQANLSAFPARGEEDKYRELNDVGTCLFIRAEAKYNSGKTEEAKAEFEALIESYPWAQAWDPRGWHWSIKEKSQATIDLIIGKKPAAEEEPFEPLKRTRPQLHTLGTEKVIDYSKYGEFKNVGTEYYQFVMTDKVGLAEATGEGIYPNTASVYNNPRRKIVKKEGRLKGGYWDSVNSDDLESAYFKWVKASEPWGVRLFYLGLIFEKAEMYHEALKAYHALIVHFPKTVGWTYWQTPWYPAQAAIAKIKHILRIHPELKLKAKWMKIQIKNGFDNDVNNDVFIVYPGKIEKKTFMDKLKENLGRKDTVPLKNIVKRVGEGKVRLVQYDNGHWQMLVDDKPFVLHGVTYDPTKIGQSPDKGTLANWMEEDSNNNGKADGPYDTWVDKNRNNKQDDDEPVVGDFQLMKEMGVNVIRFYHVPTTPHKEILRDMYENYGIRVVLGDFLGKYTVGSGADWFTGTDYENEEHKKNMLASVKKMVMEYKDEPFILMWVLGNENNYGVACNADKKPEAYFKFVDEVAQWIKSVDPDHPIAVVNGDTLYLDVFAKNAPNVDIFAANVYRGDYGFGSFWEQVMDAAGKPAFITEYGCPAFARHLTQEEAEAAQADYHRGNLMDIEENLAGSANGVGNALGGIAFEWVDEWWKNYEPYLHDRTSDAIGPFPGGYYYEEWFGLTSQGDGNDSPFLRQLRPAYYVYKEVWN